MRTRILDPSDVLGITDGRPMPKHPPFTLAEHWEKKHGKGTAPRPVLDADKADETGNNGRHVNLGSNHMAAQRRLRHLRTLVKYERVPKMVSDHFCADGDE